MTEKPILRRDGNDLVLWLRVRPRAKTTALALEGGRLVAALTALPVRGQANKALQRLLATEFEVAPSAVLIAKGSTSRYKRVRIRQPTVVPGILRTALAGLAEAVAGGQADGGGL